MSPAQRASSTLRHLATDYAQMKRPGGSKETCKAERVSDQEETSLPRTFVSKDVSHHGSVKSEWTLAFEWDVLTFAVALCAVCHSS